MITYLVDGDQNVVGPREVLEHARGVQPGAWESGRVLDGGPGKWGGLGKVHWKVLRGEKVYWKVISGGKVDCRRALGPRKVGWPWKVRWKSGAWWRSVVGN